MNIYKLTFDIIIIVLFSIVWIYKEYFFINEDMNNDILDILSLGIEFQVGCNSRNIYLFSKEKRLSILSMIFAMDINIYFTQYHRKLRFLAAICVLYV